MKLLSTELCGGVPVYLQNLLLSFREFTNSRKKYGMDYYRFLHQLSAMDDTNLQEEQKFQNLEVQAIIRHAAEHSPFYRELYRNIAVDIQSVEDLRHLPVVEDELFIQQIEEIHTTKVLKTNSNDIEKSGFSLLHQTDLDMQRQTAVVDYFKKQHGAVNLEMKRATFGRGDFISEAQTAGAFWREVYYLNQRLYSAHHCTEPFLPLIVRNLNAYRPDFIDGLPEAILALSRFINQQRIALNFQAAAVFVETEVLSDNERLEIESAFCCSVRRWSEKSQLSPSLFECAAENLHFNMRTGVLEFDEGGDVLLTRFHTKGTPLIRLKLKEQLLAVDQPCPCGSVHPRVRIPREPESSFLQSRSRGKVTSLYLATVREKFRKVVPCIQFVQNSLDAIEILVSGKSYIPLEVEKALTQEMIAVFGEDMQFTVRSRQSDAKAYTNLVVNNLQLPNHSCHKGCGKE